MPSSRAFSLVNSRCVLQQFVASVAQLVADVSDSSRQDFSPCLKHRSVRVPLESIEGAVNISTRTAKSLADATQFVRHRTEFVRVNEDPSRPTGMVRWNGRN